MIYELNISFLKERMGVIDTYHPWYGSAIVHKKICDLIPYIPLYQSFTARGGQ